MASPPPSPNAPPFSSLPLKRSRALAAGEPEAGEPPKRRRGKNKTASYVVTNLTRITESSANSRYPLPAWSTVPTGSSVVHPKPYAFPAAPRLPPSPTPPLAYHPLSHPSHPPPTAAPPPVRRKRPSHPRRLSSSRRASIIPPDQPISPPPSGRRHSVPVFTIPDSELEALEVGGEVMYQEIQRTYTPALWLSPNMASATVPPPGPSHPPPVEKPVPPSSRDPHRPHHPPASSRLPPSHTPLPSAPIFINPFGNPPHHQYAVQHPVPPAPYHPYHTPQLPQQHWQPPIINPTPFLPAEPITAYSNPQHPPNTLARHSVALPHGSTLFAPAVERRWSSPTASSHPPAASHWALPERYQAAIPPPSPLFPTAVFWDTHSAPSNSTQLLSAPGHPNITPAMCTPPTNGATKPKSLSPTEIALGLDPNAFGPVIPSFDPSKLFRPTRMEDVDPFVRAFGLPFNPSPDLSPTSHLPSWADAPVKGSFRVSAPGWNTAPPTKLPSPPAPHRPPPGRTQHDYGKYGFAAPSGQTYLPPQPPPQPPPPIAYPNPLGPPEGWQDPFPLESP